MAGDGCYQGKSGADQRRGRKEKSKNIAKAVEELEKLIGKVDE